MPLWDVMKQDLTCHQPCHPLPPRLLGPLSPQSRQKVFLLPLPLQKSQSWDFSKLFCLHCSLFLKNQHSLLMNSHQLPFLPRNLETVSKCCSLRHLDSYSADRAGTKFPWPPVHQGSAAGVRGVWAISVHLRFFTDPYMGCTEMVFV